jgi:hypothetical protein
MVRGAAAAQPAPDEDSGEDPGSAHDDPVANNSPASDSPGGGPE